MKVHFVGWQRSSTASHPNQSVDIELLGEAQGAPADLTAGRPGRDKREATKDVAPRECGRFGSIFNVLFTLAGETQRRKASAAFLPSGSCWVAARSGCFV